MHGCKKCLLAFHICEGFVTPIMVSISLIFHFNESQLASITSFRNYSTWGVTTGSQCGHIVGCFIVCEGVRAVSRPCTRVLGLFWRLLLP